MLLRFGCLLTLVVLSKYSQAKSKSVSNSRDNSLSTSILTRSAKSRFFYFKKRQNRNKNIRNIEKKDFSKRKIKKKMFKKKALKESNLKNTSKLKASRKNDRLESRAPIAGDLCQYVDFGGARTQGTGCSDGAKVVISQR